MPKPSALRQKALTVTTVTLASLALGACGSGSGSSGGASAPNAQGSAPGQVSLIRNGQLTVCTHMSYKPFQFKAPDGRIVGFDVDLMDLVAKDLGVRQEIVDIEFRQIYDGTAFATRKCDLGAAGITMNPQRQQTVLFSEPYFDATQALLVKKGAGITDLASLRGKKLGAQTETTGLEYAQKNKDANGYELVIFDDLPLSVNNVKSGRVDAAINDNGVLYDYAKNNPDTEVVAEFDTGEKYGIAAKRNDPNGSALIAKVNASINKARADGTYNQIYAKWFGAAPSSKTPMSTTMPATSS